MTSTTAGFDHALGRICRVRGAAHAGEFELARVSAGRVSRH